MPDSPFGAWLRQETRTVAQLAAELDVSVSAIYHLRSGYHSPSLAVALRIAELSNGAVPVDGWAAQRKKRARAEAPKREGKRRGRTT